MAMQQLSSRSLRSKVLISSLLSRTFSSCPLPPSHRPLSLSLLRTALRPLSSAVAVAATSNTSVSRSSTTHSFSTRATSSSLNDTSPNWSNRPPKETILLDGCDFEHWLVVLEKPDESMTRDDIIDSYIKTLAKIVGSEEEARMKIYSVSTRHYFAFGALVSEELSNKIKELPGVRWVLPDSYLDVRNKDYGGEPFIDGQAVPYDPKYHEEWVRNNAKANERNRRNDRPRQNDRSRNFERRRENMQSRDGMGGQGGMPHTPPSNTGAPPLGGTGRPGGPPTGNMSGYGPPPSGGNMSGYGQPPSGGNMSGYGPPPSGGNMSGPAGNMGRYVAPPSGGMDGPGGPTGNMRGYRGPPGPLPNGMGGPGVPPYGGTSGPQHNYMGGSEIPQNNHGGMPQGSAGAPSNPGWSNNVPGNVQNFQNNANGGGGAPQDYQNGYSQGRDGPLSFGNRYPA